MVESCSVNNPETCGLQGIEFFLDIKDSQYWFMLMVKEMTLCSELPITGGKKVNLQTCQLKAELILHLTVHTN